MTVPTIDFLNYPLVFITGETGTGKSLLARHLHEQYGYQVVDEDDRFEYEENCGLGTWESKVPLDVEQSVSDDQQIVVVFQHFDDYPSLLELMVGALEIHIPQRNEYAIIQYHTAK